MACSKFRIFVLLFTFVFFIQLPQLANTRRHRPRRYYPLKNRQFGAKNHQFGANSIQNSDANGIQNSDAKDVQIYGAKGIQNSGSTCFANSVAQVLFRMDSVKAFVLQSESPEISGLKSLFLSLDSPETPSPIGNHGAQFIPSQFPCGEQGDAEEFYTAWLDILDKNGFSELESELFLAVNLNRTQLDSESGENVSVISTDVWNTVKVTFPADFSSEAQNPIPMEDLLTRSDGPFGEEQLNENLKQIYQIASLPRYIAFSFIRTGFDANFAPIKITTPVIVPEVLHVDNLTQFSSSSTAPSEQYGYKLKMFVTHSGNVSSGHYFAHVRDSSNPDNWLLVDDENVRNVTHQQALEAAKHSSICFFERDF